MYATTRTSTETAAVLCATTLEGRLRRQDLSQTSRPDLERLRRLVGERQKAVLLSRHRGLRHAELLIHGAALHLGLTQNVRDLALRQCRFAVLAGLELVEFRLVGSKRGAEFLPRDVRELDLGKKCFTGKKSPLDRSSPSASRRRSLPSPPVLARPYSR